MAGYSGTPLPKKLGIKPGHRVSFLNEPAEFRDALGELPEGVEVRARARGPLDVIVAFCTRRSELEGRIERLLANIVRDGALPLGLVDNKVCAIDATWSGLRLVIRLENR